MKYYVMVVIVLLSALSFTNSVLPQNNVWIYIKDYQGVGVYWRYRQELKDQYISEMKFVNHNSYKVEVSVKPEFICASGSREEETSMMFNIRANGEQAGQWAGLFWYPCDGKQPPRSGG